MLVHSPNAPNSRDQARLKLDPNVAPGVGGSDPTTGATTAATQGGEEAARTGAELIPEQDPGIPSKTSTASLRPGPKTL